VGYQTLLVERAGAIASITLNRPEARNAMSDKLTPALRTQIRERGEDADVGAILITGAGTAFCSGGDVKGMGGRGPRGQMTFEERLGDLRWRQAALTGALVAVRKPTIAALPGAAAGAGLAIALACDIRIAAQSAFVSTGYARVGLSGDYGIAWLLTRAVGSARARELMFMAERVDSERCERIGLVNRVVPDDKLQAEAFALAKSLAEGPRVALRNMKDNLDDALHIDYPTALHREAERLVQSSRTEDHKAAVRAFVEKRKPVFVGR
jgi:enoyl-CoA hydratase/carnithine racemase